MRNKMIRKLILLGLLLTVTNVPPDNGILIDLFGYSIASGALAVGETPADASDPAAITLAKSAKAKYEAKDYSGAIKDMSKAIELAPGIPMLYCMRSSMFATVKQWNPALDDANAAIKADPAFLDGYAQRAVANIGLDNLDAVYDDYLKIKQMDPASAEAAHLHAVLTELYGLRAPARMTTGKWQEAIEDCKKMMVLNPQDSTPYMLSSQCKVALQDFAGASKDGKRAKELEGKKTKNETSKP